MNKTKLVDAIAAACDLSKVATQHALDSVINNIVNSVADGKTVQLVGVGGFASGACAERTGRNSRTGEGIKNAAVATTVE